MKAIYKKTIEEQLNELIDRSVAINREIDFILVTASEAIKIYDKFNSCEIPNYKKVDTINNSFYLGIKLKVEGLE